MSFPTSRAAGSRRSSIGSSLTPKRLRRSTGCRSRGSSARSCSPSAAERPLRHAEQLVGIRDRDAPHDPVVRRLVVPHPPERRRVDVDRRRRLVPLVAHAVDVGRIEVERLPGLVLLRLLPDPAVRVALEEILPQDSFADENRAGGAIVVVVSRVLPVRPADEPHVDVRVAIQLLVVPFVNVVANVLAPQFLFAPDRLREGEQLGPRQVVICGEALRKERCDISHARRRLGLSHLTSFSTLSPKRDNAVTVGCASTTGTSVPKTICSTPNVSTHSSIARRPYDAVSKNTFVCRTVRTPIPREPRRSSWNGAPPARIAKTTGRSGHRSWPAASQRRYASCIWAV